MIELNNRLLSDTSTQQTSSHLLDFLISECIAYLFHFLGMCILNRQCLVYELLLCQVAILSIFFEFVFQLLLFGMLFPVNFSFLQCIDILVFVIDHVDEGIEFRCLSTQFLFISLHHFFHVGHRNSLLNCKRLACKLNFNLLVLLVLLIYKIERNNQ